MSDTSFYDYDDADVSEAVEAVTGEGVIRACIDDEHLFWYTLDSDGNIGENQAGAEGVDDLFSNEVAEKILAYLEAYYETI
jgi:hypothetical protein